MLQAEYHPEHDRSSCSDGDLCNASPEGSTGCARCTALKLDKLVWLTNRTQNLKKLFLNYEKARNEVDRIKDVGRTRDIEAAVIQMDQLRKNLVAGLRAADKEDKLVGSKKSI